MTLHPTRALALALLTGSLALATPALATEIELTAQPLPEVEADADADPNATGFGINETAFMPEKGSFSWTAIDFGLHHFELSVHENVTLTANTTLPVFVVGATVGTRVGGEVADDLHVSVSADVGGGAVFGVVDDVADAGFAVFGGGPSLTYGSPDLYFNAKARAYGFAVSETGNAAWLAMPSIGGGVRVADSVRLYADIGPVFVGDGEGLKNAPGEFWAAQYGVHFHGDNLYGDVSFVMPIYDGAEEILRYLPMGFPNLTFGVKI